MSLSREFAAFVAGLTYDDLPAAVVDRAKGVTLQALSSALVAHDMPASKQALALMQEEEAGGGGVATRAVSGAKLTKAGVAFVNAEMILAGGKWDTFRMLTHPGTAICPRRWRRPSSAGASGKTFLTGVAAAYEVMERMAAEFIPTVMSRGFHPGPVFGIFGAAIAAAKIQGLDATRSTARSRNASTSPSGNSKAFERRAVAARGRRGAERSARRRDGETGNAGRRNRARRRGRVLPFLCRQQSRRAALYVHRHNSTSIANITEGLGKDWIFLETLYRIYSTAGYNIAHVDVTAKLCEEHDISYADIDRIEARVNWFETEYPSPAFPTPAIDGKPKVGSTQYFSAYGAAMRGFPMLRHAMPGPGDTDPPEVLDLMHRVTLIPVVRQTLFGPRVTVFTKDGRSYTERARAANSSGTSKNRPAASGPSRRHPDPRHPIRRTDRQLPASGGGGEGGG